MRTNIRRTDHLVAAVMTRVLTLAVVVLVGSAWPTMAQAPATDAKQALVTVKGMQCPFCAYGIKKHLAKIPGVGKVDVDLAKNRAIVDFTPGATPTDEQIKRAVRDAGFTPGKIEWRLATTRGEAEPIARRPGATRS